MRIWASLSDLVVDDNSGITVHVTVRVDAHFFRIGLGDFVNDYFQPETFINPLMTTLLIPFLRHHQNTRESEMGT